MSNLPKIRFDQILSTLFLISVFLFQASIGLPSVGAITSDAEVRSEYLEIELNKIPVLRPDVDPQVFLNKLSAQSVMVTDEKSGSVLLAKNQNRPVSPASTTKLMTALVALETYQPSQIFTVREEAFTNGNTIELEVGEQLFLNDLLHGLLISSGNDTAFVLANNHPLGYEGFVAEMNAMAGRLHLDSSHFENPSGLDQEDHLMSARDLAILTREVMKHPLLSQIVGTKNTVIEDVDGEYQHYLYSTNELLGREEGVVGVKTGTTTLAGETLVTQVEKNGHTLVVVVLGSSSRYQDTKAILDWVDQSFDWFPVDEV